MHVHPNSSLIRLMHRGEVPLTSNPVPESVPTATEQSGFEECSRGQMVSGQVGGWRCSWRCSSYFCCWFRAECG
jgi:hypothetical protein